MGLSLSNAPLLVPFSLRRQSAADDSGLVGRKTGLPPILVGHTEGQEAPFCFQFLRLQILSLSKNNHKLFHPFLSENQVLGHTKHSFPQRCGNLTSSANLHLFYSDITVAVPVAVFQ